MIDLRQKVSGRQAAEILTALFLILWRIWDIPLVALWRDWVTLLCLYWFSLVCCGRPAVQTRVRVVAMSGFMLLYAWGQFPHLLALFRVSG